MSDPFPDYQPLRTGLCHDYLSLLSCLVHDRLSKKCQLNGSMISSIMSVTPVLHRVPGTEGCLVHGYWLSNFAVSGPQSVTAPHLSVHGWKRFQMECRMPS